MSLLPRVIKYPLKPPSNTSKGNADVSRDIFNAFKMREDSPQSFKDLSAVPSEILTQIPDEGFVPENVAQPQVVKQSNKKSSKRSVAKPQHQERVKEILRACFLTTLVQHKFADAFQALNNVLYRQPNKREQAWFEQNGLPKNTPIYIKQPRVVRANIELKQRALSFVEAAWKVVCISQPPKTNLQLDIIQKELFEKFKKIQDKIDKAGHRFTDPNYYNYFLTQEMEKSLVEKLKQFLISKFQIPEKEASKVLNQFEAFANWERQAKPPQSLGFAVVTKGVVRVSRPLIVPLTVEQKKEFLAIQEFDNKKEEARTLPWFTVLPASTKTWLQQNANRIINGDLPCPPSVARFVPGLANVQEDLVFITDKDGKVKSKSSTPRFAVPTPVDIKEKAEQLRITIQNTKQLVGWLNDQDKSKQRLKDFFGLTDDQIAQLKPFVLFQRLLSPVRLADGTGLSGSDNNSLFLGTTRRAIKESVKESVNGVEIYVPNWPINSLQTLAANPFKDPENQETRKKLGEFAFQLIKTLKTAQKLTLHVTANVWFESLSKHKNFSAQDLQILTSALNSNYTSFSFENPEHVSQFKLAIAAFAQYELLWEQYEQNKKFENPHGLNIYLRMAALEMIIAEGLGLVDSSGCKSAKDREGVLTMEMTALKKYFFEHDQMPNINDKVNVNEMASYFADEYLSDYNQQVVSKRNSSGDSAVQDGKGVLSMIEKFKKVPQMIPRVYAAQIGKKLDPENSELSEDDAVKVANDEMKRQDNLGKSATWGKVKTGFKKIMHVLKELFGSKKELDLKEDPIATDKTSIVTLPKLIVRTVLNDKDYIQGCSSVVVVHDDMNDDDENHAARDPEVPSSSPEFQPMEESLNELQNLEPSTKRFGCTIL